MPTVTCPDCGGSGLTLTLRATDQAGGQSAVPAECKTCKGTGTLSVPNGSGPS
jgi:DnaJ-class molecular chaperone